MTESRINNIHITLTPFRNESRILKQTQSLVASNIVDKIWICALYEDGLMLSENVDERRKVNRFRLRTRNLPRNPITQAMTYLEFVFRILIFSLGKNIKLINIHSLPLLPLGAFLSFITRSKLVYDTHELETETDNSSRFRKRIAKFIEKYFIKFSQLTVVVGFEIQKWYEEKYPSINIVTVLNCPRKIESKKTNLFRTRLKIPEDKIIILYQGGLTEDRGIKLLIETFSTIIEDPYVLILMGYGNMENEVKNYAKLYKNIFFLDAVKPEEVLNYTSSADIGVHWIDNSCLNHQFCLPNKLFEYLMAGLPVVVSNLLEMKNVVQKHKVGVIIEDWMPVELKMALIKFNELPKKELEKNVKLASEIFSWEVQEKYYIKHIENILNVSK